MSGKHLERRLARVERRQPPAGAAALFVLEDGDDELPAWAAYAPMRAVLDLREAVPQCAHVRGPTVGVRVWSR